MMNNLSGTVGNLFNTVKDKIDQSRGTDIEKKVKEATSSENWGASSSLKDEIARATYDLDGYNEVMPLIWKRIQESGQNWKIVFKTLELLEFLLRNGSERVISEARSRLYQIRTLRDYQCQDAQGHDRGSGVREKSQVLVNLLNDDAMLREEREKAERLRGKYTGHSSGQYAYQSRSSYQSNSRYDEFPHGNDVGSMSARYTESREEPVKKVTKKKKKKVVKKESDGETASEIGVVQTVKKKTKKKKSSKAVQKSADDIQLPSPEEDHSFATAFHAAESVQNPPADELIDLFSSVSVSAPSQPSAGRNSDWGDFSGFQETTTSNSQDLFANFSAPARTVSDVFMGFDEPSSAGGDDLLGLAIAQQEIKEEEEEEFGDFTSAASEQVVSVKQETSWDAGLVDLGNLTGEPKKLPTVSMTRPSAPTLNASASAYGFAAPPPQTWGMPQQQQPQQYNQQGQFYGF